MARDRGVSGSYIDRAFYGTEKRGPGWTAEGARAERGAKRRAMWRDVNALEKLQRQRPLRPPGRP